MRAALVGGPKQEMRFLGKLMNNGDPEAWFLESPLVLGLRANM